MNINTFFKEIKGRNIDLSGVDYTNAYQQKDIKTATAIMYLMQHQGVEDAQNYGFRYDKDYGIYSSDIVEDIFMQQNQHEKIEYSQELSDYIDDIIQASNVGYKISDTLISAVKVHFYTKVIEPIKCTEEEFYRLFSDEQKNNGYKTGKKFWKNLSAIRQERINQSQPE